MPWCRVWLPVLFAVSQLAGAVPAPPQLWGDLPPGKHSVGFRVLWLTRPGDSWDGSSPGRPLRVFVWYPARASRGAVPMRFGDYLDCAPSGPPFQALYDHLHARELRTASRQFQPEDPAKLARLREAATAAVRDAPPRGRSALVLHSLGLNDYQAESTVLSEFLASHGYVVANIPQTPRSASEPALRFRAEDLRLQASDLEFAAEELRKLPFVRADGDFAVIGHSAGAVAGLILNQRNPKAAMLVSLDGSVDNKDGIAVLRELGIAPGSVRAVVAHLRKTVPAQAYDPAFLDDLPPGKRRGVAFRQATHFDFQNWPLLLHYTGAEDPRAGTLRSSAEGQKIHLAVIRSVLEILDAGFRGWPAGLTAILKGVQAAQEP